MIIYDYCHGRDFIIRIIAMLGCRRDDHAWDYYDYCDDRAY